MNPVAIGIDVGGTKIAGALIGPDGSTTTACVVPTPRTGSGADPGAMATSNLVGRLLTEAEHAGLAVVGIGLGVPEYVTPDGRISSAEVLDWRPEDLDAMGAGIEVTVESDVRCGALAERVVGDGGGYASFLFVSIGTGISHTLSIGDRLLPGHRGEAIALGEFPVAADQAIRADAPLTVESQASGRAIEDHLTRQRSEQRSAGPASSSASSDELAARAGRIVAAAIVAAVGLVDPEVVILGGGIGSSQGPYTESLIDEAGQRLARRPGAPVILRSQLGNRGGMLGAGLAAHQGSR